MSENCAKKRNFDPGDLEPEETETKRPKTTSYFNILDFSDCVLTMIFQCLDSYDLYALNFTCKRFKYLIKERKLWDVVDLRNNPMCGRKFLFFYRHLNDSTKNLMVSGINDYDKCISGFQCRQLERISRNLTVLAIEFQFINSNEIQLRDFPAGLKELSLRGTRVLGSRNFLQDANKKFPVLHTLILDECSWFHEYALMALSKFESLENLSVYKCDNLNDSVAYMSITTRYGFKNLLRIDARLTKIGDQFLKCLNNLKTLREIYLEAPPKKNTDSKRLKRQTDVNEVYYLPGFRPYVRALVAPSIRCRKRLNKRQKHFDHNRSNSMQNPNRQSSYCTEVFRDCISAECSFRPRIDEEDYNKPSTSTGQQPGRANRNEKCICKQLKIKCPSCDKCHKCQVNLRAFEPLERCRHPVLPRYANMSQQRPNNIEPWPASVLPRPVAMLENQFPRPAPPRQATLNCEHPHQAIYNLRDVDDQGMFVIPDEIMCEVEDNIIESMEETLRRINDGANDGVRDAVVSPLDDNNHDVPQANAEARAARATNFFVCAPFATRLSEREPPDDDTVAVVPRAGASTSRNSNPNPNSAATSNPNSAAKPHPNSAAKPPTNSPRQSRLNDLWRRPSQNYSNKADGAAAPSAAANNATNQQRASDDLEANLEEDRQIPDDVSVHVICGIGSPGGYDEENGTESFSESDNYLLSDEDSCDEIERQIPEVMYLRSNSDDSEFEDNSRSWSCQEMNVSDEGVSFFTGSDPSAEDFLGQDSILFKKPFSQQCSCRNTAKNYENQTAGTSSTSTNEDWNQPGPSGVGNKRNKSSIDSTRKSSKSSGIAFEDQDFSRYVTDMRENLPSSNCSHFGKYSYSRNDATNCAGYNEINRNSGSNTRCVQSYERNSSINNQFSGYYGQSNTHSDTRNDYYNCPRYGQGDGQNNSGNIVFYDPLRRDSMNATNQHVQYRSQNVENITGNEQYGQNDGHNVRNVTGNPYFGQYYSTGSNERRNQDSDYNTVNGYYPNLGQNPNSIQHSFIPQYNPDYRTQNVGQIRQNDPRYNMAAADSGQTIPIYTPPQNEIFGQNNASTSSQFHHVAQNDPPIYGQRDPRLNHNPSHNPLLHVRPQNIGQTAAAEGGSAAPRSGSYAHFSRYERERQTTENAERNANNEDAHYDDANEYYVRHYFIDRQHGIYYTSNSNYQIGQISSPFGEFGTQLYVHTIGNGQQILLERISYLRFLQLTGNCSYLIFEVSDTDDLADDEDENYQNVEDYIPGAEGYQCMETMDIADILNAGNNSGVVEQATETKEETSTLELVENNDNLPANNVINVQTQKNNESNEIVDENVSSLNSDIQSAENTAQPKYKVNKVQRAEENKIHNDLWPEAATGEKAAAAPGEKVAAAAAAAGGGGGGNATPANLRIEFIVPSASRNPQVQQNPNNPQLHQQNDGNRGRRRNRRNILSPRHLGELRLYGHRRRSPVLPNFYSTLGEFSRGPRQPSAVQRMGIGDGHAGLQRNQVINQLQFLPSSLNNNNNGVNENANNVPRHMRVVIERFHPGFQIVVHNNNFMVKHGPTRLKVFVARGFKRLTNQAMRYLSSIRLELLDVTRTSVTHRGITEFLLVNPDCRVVHESMCRCDPDDC